MNHAPALSVRQGLVHVSAAAVAWGTGGAAGAALHDAGNLTPAAVSFWRFACGAALLLAVARAGRPSWRAVLVVGPAMAVCQAAYFAAIAETGVAVATMITMGATPILVAAAGRVFLGERLSRTGLACTGLACAGLVMLTGGAAAVTPAGAGHALLSAAAYTVVTLTTRGMAAEGVAAWGFAGGALCLLPFAAAGLLPAGHPVASALLLAYLAAVPTALAYGLFFSGLRVVGGTTAAVVSLLEPLVAAVIGVVLLGERPAAVQVCGGGVLLCALVWLAAAELRRKSRPGTRRC